MTGTHPTALLASTICNWALALCVSLCAASSSVADVPGLAYHSDLPLADQVIVRKAQRKLILYRDGVALREFPIALGPRPRGHKLQEGDERTPEGRYLLDYKNPDSDFYKSIHISYPNDRDRQRADALGVDPGGSIMIHGIPNETTQPASLIQRFNWTNGCIAVNNRDMEQIWLAVEAGTPIEILP